VARKTGKKEDRRASPPIVTFRDALIYAGLRPPDDADRDEKKNYAQRLSAAIAILIANRLRTTGGFRGILPESDGSGVETPSASGASKKKKRTDVRYATAETGLELLVSIKTLNYQDATKNRKTGKIVLGRYTKNMVRNDHELRAEAMDHHERFPYAVLVGLFFLPVEACDDGVSGRSSFAHAVVTFRPRAGRLEPSDPYAKFERFFIGLYQTEPQGGAVGFFDVVEAPARRGRPPWPDEAANPLRGGKLLTLDQVIVEIVREYGVRNRTYIRWADETPEAAPDAVSEKELEDEDEEDEE